MCVVRLFVFFCLIVLSGPVRADPPNLSFSTGGMVRLPNTQLPDDADNAMFEGWFKAGLPLRLKGRNDLTLSIRVKVLADTAGYSFNNSTTLGLELAYKVPLGKAASLTFKIRHDWQDRANSVQRRGLRAFVDFFYLNYKKPPDAVQMFGLDARARIVKVYGTLTFPETLVSGDTNLTGQGGLDYSVNLALPNTQLTLSPYLGLFVAADTAGFGYNNKAQPSVGIRLKRALPGGDIHLGLRYQGDYRWRSDTFEHGPSVFVGWYSSF